MCALEFNSQWERRERSKVIIIIDTLCIMYYSLITRQVIMYYMVLNYVDITI